MSPLTLEITSQEKHLVTETVSSVTAMTQTGQVTILPGHIPLLSRLKAGELIYQIPSGKKTSFAIYGGFLEVSERDIVTVLADSAIRSDQINLEKAQEAVVNAQKALAEAENMKDRLKIENQLRAALLQTNIAKKYRHKA